MGSPASSPVKRVSLLVLLAAALGIGVATWYDQPLQDADTTTDVAMAPSPAAPASAAAPEAAETVAGAGVEVVPPAEEGPLLPFLERESFGHRAGLHKVKTDVNLSASAAIVIDQESGKVLLDKNVQSVLPIASLTKLMTSLVIADARLPMDQAITITEDDVDGERHSRSRLRVGTTLTRSEAMQLALMSSENRAAHALGRTFPGGLDAFVNLMNSKARALGTFEVFNGDYRKLFDAPAAYDAVTAADVQALAKKILRIQNRTTGLLKPVAAAPVADKKEAAK